MGTGKRIIGLLLLTWAISCGYAEKRNLHKEQTEMPTPVMTAKMTLEDLESRGYKTFTYEDPETADTVIMQQYFMVFLKTGPVRDQGEAELDSLQQLHLAHLTRMYEEGYADISGPFGDDGEIRGVTIYNTPTLRIADSLANLDPMVKAGRLVIEVHPWWAAKGFPLR